MARLPPEAAALIVVLLVVCAFLLIVSLWQQWSIVLLRRRVRKIEVAFRDVLDETEWPWCDACGSYHHPENPTCRRYPGWAKALAREARAGGTVHDPLTELASIIGGKHDAVRDPPRG